MPNLTIRFINARDIVSKLVSGETFSLICHTEGLNRAGDAWIGAHAFTGVEARPLDWCKNLTWERRYSIPVSDEQYESAMEYMEQSIGIKYNYRGILGLLFHNRRWNNQSRMDCSEFMFRWLWAGGKMSLNVAAGYQWRVTPETLHLSSLLIGRCVYRR